MYSIGRNEKDEIIVKSENPDHDWTMDDLTLLREQDGIIYDGHLFAIRIIPLPMENPFFQIGREDDGVIRFEDKPFNSAWAGNLKKILGIAMSIQ